MSKQTFKVVKMVVCPRLMRENTSKTEIVEVARLSRGKAISLRDKLNEATLETFNPDRVVSYLVQPA